MASLMYLEESYAWIFIEPPSQIKLDLMKIEYSFRHLSHMVILRSSNCQSPCPCAPQCLHTPVLLKKLSKLAPFIVSCMVVQLVLYCCPWWDNLFFSSNLGSTGFLILKSGTKSLRILLSVIIGHKLMCGVVIFWLMGVWHGHMAGNQSKPRMMLGCWLDPFRSLTW